MNDAIRSYVVECIRHEIRCREYENLEQSLRGKFVLWQLRAIFTEAIHCRDMKIFNIIVKFCRNVVYLMELSEAIGRYGTVEMASQFLMLKIDEKCIRNCMIYACSSKNVEMARMMMNAGVENVTQALYSSVGSGSAECVELCLEREIPQYILTSALENKLAMMTYDEKEKNLLKIVLLLINAGADVDDASNRLKGKHHIIRYLMNNGVSFDKLKSLVHPYVIQKNHYCSVIRKQLDLLILKDLVNVVCDFLPF